MQTNTRIIPGAVLARIVIASVGLFLISGPPSGLAASPTLRVAIERSTNRTALVTWGPPQATLQRAPGVTSGFANIPGAAMPYRVDTRLTSAAGYRVCLPVSQPTVFIWHDTILQPGKVALEWSPRDWRLQETSDFSQWQNSAAPATDWYFHPTPLESPAPGSVLAGTRAFRIMPSAAAAAGGPALDSPVFSVNYVAYAVFALQVGQPNYFSFPLVPSDRNLNTLLPMPSEASGSTLYFYDASTQSMGPPLEFDADLFGGWWDPVFNAPALRPAGESACVIIPQSSAPGATRVYSTMLGEVPQGTFRRILPPGRSLNGPLAPGRGGITSVHNLQPNDEDQVLLFNPATRDFDTYEFFFDFWIPDEPVIGPTDAFYYVNNSGTPLDWVRSFQIN